MKWLLLFAGTDFFIVIINSAVWIDNNKSDYPLNKKQSYTAVETLLASNNIPVGMELFKAENNSQWETIKKWINDSDIYMLILDGRDG